ncbi:MAG: glycosyltransferase [Alphaproteobacteria bacterium]|nr:glycosyltransferase [Alphaproteobacteria bacterium]
MAIRILHVFSTFKVGGPQARLASLVDALPDGYEHVIAAMDGATPAAALITRQDRIRLVEPPAKTASPWVRACSIAALLRREAPDLVATYNWGAIEVAALARALGRRVVHFEDGFGPDETASQVPRRRWFRRVVLPFVDVVVVPSGTLERIARTTWGVAGARLRNIPNGVDTGAFDAPPDPGLLPGFVRRPGEVVVGTVAGLRPEKNVARLVRCFAAADTARRARLVVAGEGPERPAIEAAAAAAGIADRVVLAGFVPQPARYLGCFDIFAISSDTEQFPISLVEAMAARLPAASTDVGDVRVILDPANAPYVVGRGDEAALTAALAALIADGELRARIGAANRARVEREYSFARMCRTYDALFRDVAAGRRPA